MVVMTSWIRFLIVVLLQMTLISLYHTAFVRDPTLTYELGVVPLSLILYARFHIVGWVTCFSLFEKICKEKFIINFTNE